MSDTQTYFGTLVVQSCCNCGLNFGVDAAYDLERRANRDTFYCPAGHALHYLGKTEAEKAREEAERQRQLKESYIRLANDRTEQRDYARRQAAAARGVVTRVKRRIGKGVCPCCNRTFQDLARHMTGQHPDWSKSDVA